MLSFVILHYQVLEETINCIQEIKNKIKNDYKIIVVDNCSPNGSGNKLKNMYKDDPFVKIILSNVNSGFAKGNNLGYRIAKVDNPDYIIVMNNDVMIETENLLQKLNEIYAETNFDILGPDIYSTKTKLHQNPQRESNYKLDDLKQQYNKLLFKNKFKFLLKIKYLFGLNKAEEKQNPRFESIHFNVVLHGACYIFSKNFIQTHEDCFYNGTFMYYESYILHYLGSRENLTMIYHPEIKVLHHEDVATNGSYGSSYNKAVFVNKCLLDSCGKFIKLIESDLKKNM
ncbi:glycosyltransferase family 2 protein [Enterococcus cecorum]|nr:glycosyltransferase family 2 protein [Enterococcus cecorum]